MRFPRVAMLMVGAAALAGCASGSQAGTAGSAKRLRVVTSVAPITNIVRNVVGDRADLKGVVPEGVDSHTFEPTPETAKTLTGADLVFLNGLHLEEPTRKLAEANKAGGGEIVLMGELTIAPEQYQYDFSFPKEKGDPNPHLWMDPELAKSYAKIVADKMSQRDPSNRHFYQANYGEFAQREASLDGAIRKAVDSIPAQQKKLLTYHDSFAYFSARYGVTVIGAVQASDFRDPTPQEVASLIDQIKRERVPAVFGSEVFPSKVLEQIARESGAKFVDRLRDDGLPGDARAKEHTYIGMMVEDVAAITDALGGDSSPLKVVDVADVV